MPNPNVARNVWFVREFPFQPEGRANVLLGQVFRWRVTFLPWLRFLRGLVGDWLSKRAGNSSHPCISEDFRRSGEKFRAHSHAKKIAGHWLDYPHSRRLLEPFLTASCHSYRARSSASVGMIQPVARHYVHLSALACRLHCRWIWVDPPCGRSVSR